MEGKLQFHSCMKWWHRFWFLAGFNSTHPFEKMTPWYLYSSSFSLIIDNTVLLDSFWMAVANFVYNSTLHLDIMLQKLTVQISSIQSLSHVQLFATPWTGARQASLSNSNSQNMFKLMVIESVMSSNHLTLLCLFYLLPSIFPSIRIFSYELALCIRWPKYCSFSFSIRPSDEYSGLNSSRLDWFGLLEVQGTLKSLLQTTVQKHQFFGAQLSL